MTRSDVQFIEHELGITVSESYLHAVMPFRIPAMAGNTDSQLWDDAHSMDRFGGSTKVWLIVTAVTKHTLDSLTEQMSSTATSVQT
jgi:hypothetical protein